MNNRTSFSRYQLFDNIRRKLGTRGKMKKKPYRSAEVDEANAPFTTPLPHFGSAPDSMLKRRDLLRSESKMTAPETGTNEKLEIKKSLAKIEQNVRISLSNIYVKIT